MDGILGGYRDGVLGAVTANPSIARQVAAQRAANKRPDVTDFMGYGPTWQGYLENLNQNLRAQIPGLGDTGDEMVNKALGMLGNFAPFGLTAFHGSPHKFDKFDMSKMGTGEGAQAYGHGLYFAESPQVARSYQFAGQPAYVAPRTVNLANNALALSGGDKAKAIARLNQQAAQTPIGSRQPIYDAINNFDKLTSGRVGSLYKVDIPDEAVGKMLDWDRPLSQQSPSVQDAINRVARDPRFALDKVADDMRGVDWKALLDNPEAVKELNRLGVPGIKYLDQGSRAGGKGTSNFVVFDDQLPKILDRE